MLELLRWSSRLRFLFQLRSRSLSAIRLGYRLLFMDTRLVNTGILFGWIKRSSRNFSYRSLFACHSTGCLEAWSTFIHGTLSIVETALLAADGLKINRGRYLYSISHQKIVDGLLLRALLVGKVLYSCFELVKWILHVEKVVQIKRKFGFGVNSFLNFLLRQIFHLMVVVLHS